MLRNKELLCISVNAIILLFSFLITNLVALTCLLLYYSIILLYQSRKNLYMFVSVLMIAYSNYGISVYRYWLTDGIKYNQITTSTSNYDLIGLRVSIFLIFLVWLLVFIKPLKMHQIKKINLQHKFKNRNSPLLVVVSCMALILIWILYYRFSLGERAEYSPQYEYSTIFFIIGLKYAGQKKLLLFPVLLLACFYVVFDFAGGQRSTGVQIAIIVALMVFYRYLSPKKILLYGFFGMFVTKFVAVLRKSFFAPDFQLSDIFLSMSETYFAPDTAGYAYYTSITYIAIMDIYNIAERLSQFADFVTSLFVVGTVGEALPYIAQRHYSHGFGGVLGIYMYYYLGYIGTSLIGILVAYYYRLMEKVNCLLKYRNSLVYVIIVYVSATTVRWYLYSPSQLLRGVMILSVVYLSFEFINRITKSLL